MNESVDRSSWHSMGVYASSLQAGDDNDGIHYLRLLWWGPYRGDFYNWVSFRLVADESHEQGSSSNRLM